MHAVLHSTVYGVASPIEIFVAINVTCNKIALPETLEFSDTILQAEFFALAAAATWGLGSVASASVSKQLGTIAYVRWRMFFVTILLWCWILFTQQAVVFSQHSWSLAALSGIVGIFIGDMCLFAAMNRLGPRRATILFSTHAIFSTVIGYIIFAERFNVFAYIGGALTIGGVMLAVAKGHHKNTDHSWEPSTNRWTGVAFGLTAGLFQAVGAGISKPILDAGMDPILALSIRVSVAFIALLLMYILFPLTAKPKNPITLPIIAMVAVSGCLSMGIGMGFMMIALRDGSLAIVGVLTATTPVLVLPLLWLTMKRIPPIGAWVGAVISVFGTAIILLRNSF